MVGPFMMSPSFVLASILLVFQTVLHAAETFFF